MVYNWDSAAKRTTWWKCVCVCQLQVHFVKEKMYLAHHSEEKVWSLTTWIKRAKLHLNLWSSPRHTPGANKHVMLFLLSNALLPLKGLWKAMKWGDESPGTEGARALCSSPLCLLKNGTRDNPVWKGLAQRAPLLPAPLVPTEMMMLGGRLGWNRFTGSVFICTQLCLTATTHHRDTEWCGVMNAVSGARLTSSKSRPFFS